MFKWKKGRKRREEMLTNVNRVVVETQRDRELRGEYDYLRGLVEEMGYSPGFDGRRVTERILSDMKDYVKVCAKYAGFHIEADKREILYYKKLLEEASG